MHSTQIHRNGAHTHWYGIHSGKICTYVLCVYEAWNRSIRETTHTHTLTQTQIQIHQQLHNRSFQYTLHTKWKVILNSCLFKKKTQFQRKKKQKKNPPKVFTEFVEKNNVHRNLPLTKYSICEQYEYLHSTLSTDGNHD